MVQAAARIAGKAAVGCAVWATRDFALTSPRAVHGRGAGLRA
jgi:hypothetical protein